MSLFQKIILVLLVVYTFYALWIILKYLRTLAAARRAGTPLGLKAIVRMRWCKVDPAEVIEVYGLSREVGLDVAVDQIERHVSQGGRVLRVIEALRLASTTKMRLKWRDLCQRDLAGEDVVQVVKDRMKELEKRV